MYVTLICIPVYIKGQKDLSLLWLSDLTEVGSPMISRINSDVTLGLTTGPGGGGGDSGPSWTGCVNTLF